MSTPLIAYFSPTGRTAKLARHMADASGADLYEIKPATPYTSHDLDWNDRTSRSTVEMNDPKSRPELADTDAPVAAHDTVFVGFPIWWYTAPTIINTFLEAYDFAGKKVVLFATSGGSGLGTTATQLEPSAPGADIVNGAVINTPQTSEQLAAFVARY